MLAVPVPAFGVIVGTCRHNAEGSSQHAEETAIVGTPSERRVGRLFINLGLVLGMLSLAVSSRW